MKQNPASYPSIPQPRDPPGVEDNLEEVPQLQQTPSQATGKGPGHQTRPSTIENDPDDDDPDNLPNNAKTYGNLNENSEGPPSQQEESSIVIDRDSDSETSVSSSSAPLTPSAWLILARHQTAMLEHPVRYEVDSDILQTSSQEIHTDTTNAPKEATVAHGPASYSSTPLYRAPPRKRQNMMGMLQICQALSQTTNSIPDCHAEPSTTEDDPVIDAPKNTSNKDEDVDADFGQEIRTTLTNDPVSLYSSLGYLPLISSMGESHDLSDSNSIHTSAWLFILSRSTEMKFHRVN